MSVDSVILILIVVCQGITSIWAFQISAPSNRARWGFFAITGIVALLAFWSGQRSSHFFENLSMDIKNVQSQMTRIAEAANVDPSQSANILADKIIAKLNSFQRQLNQTNSNVAALQNPPHAADGIYFDNQMVAKVAGITNPVDSNFVIPVLTSPVPFDFSKIVLFQWAVIRCSPSGASSFTQQGADTRYSYWNVHCSTIGGIAPSN